MALPKVPAVQLAFFLVPELAEAVFMRVAFFMVPVSVAWRLGIHGLAAVRDQAVTSFREQWKRREVV